MESLSRSSKAPARPLSKDFPKVPWDNWRPFFVADTSPEMMYWAASLMLQCPLKVALDCHRSFNEMDFRADLSRSRCQP
jgi:hypothetical protein